MAADPRHALRYAGVVGHSPGREPLIAAPVQLGPRASVRTEEYLEAPGGSLTGVQRPSPPYPTLPRPTLPRPTLPRPTLPGPTLPYPALAHTAHLLKWFFLKSARLATYDLNWGARELYCSSHLEAAGSDAMPLGEGRWARFGGAWAM
jgi:hypothetical protein